MRISLKDLIDVKSKYSSMRWVLIQTIKTALGIAVFSTIAYVCSAFLNAFLNLKIVIDMGAVSLLVGTIIGGASVGKSVQSFAEGKYPSLMSSTEGNNLGSNYSSNAGENSVTGISSAPIQSSVAGQSKVNIEGN